MIGTSFAQTISSQSEILDTYDGGRPDWLHTDTTSKIYYDRFLNTYWRYGQYGPMAKTWDIWWMDSAGGNTECLTCDIDELSGAYGVGTPDADSKGNYIVFAAGGHNSLRNPGKGIFFDLWFMDSQHDSAWKLRDASDIGINTTGVIHPKFSDSGTLMWSERYYDQVRSRYRWRLAKADFRPLLNKVLSTVTFLDPSLYDAASGDWKDNTSWYNGQILFSSTYEPDELDYCSTEIYKYTFGSPDTNTVLIAHSPGTGQWNEHAQLSHCEDVACQTEDKIVFMHSDDGSCISDWPGRVKTHAEYWMMDTNGDNLHELTTFNDSLCPDVCSWVSVGDSSFNNDGSAFVGIVQCFDNNDDGIYRSIYKFHF